MDDDTSSMSPLTQPDNPAPFVQPSKKGRLGDDTGGGGFMLPELVVVVVPKASVDV